MKIKDRISRVREFALDPYIEPKTPFEKAWLASVKDYLGDCWKSWDNPESYIKDIAYQRGLSMSVKDFTNYNNIILYSGGKESFLTRKIFDYFKVPYRLAIVKEINGYEGPELNEFVDNNIEADIVVDSELFKFGAISHFGRHLPAVYYYTLLLLNKYPGSIIWTGCEYTTPEWSHQNYNLDQHDIMFSDLNSDSDVSGSVYSCITHFREFDVYRIVRKYYNYDTLYSTYDNPEKKIRLEAFEDMLNLIDKVMSSPCKKHLLFEFDPFINNIRIMKPYIYDFRQDAVDFLRQFEGFNKICV